MQVNGVHAQAYRQLPTGERRGVSPTCAGRADAPTLASRYATLALVALAAATVELAIADLDAAPLLPLALTAGWVALLLVVSRLVERWASRRAGAGLPARHKPPAVVAALLLVLFGLPLVIEVVRVALWGAGYPLEILLLASLRNLGLGLAALSAWSLCLRLAALVSLFMVLVASSLAGGPLVLGLMGAYAAAGCFWLLAAYWTGLGLPLTAGSGRLPWVAALLVLAVAGGMVAAARWAPTRRLAATLAELLPSSGGTQGYHPNARGGLNDGDDEVAGDNAQTVGFVDSDVFLDSDKPSLYDLFNDIYGEPVKPRDRERQRAIALDATQVRPMQKEKAENLRPGRDFALQRQGPSHPTTAGERPPEAVVYVKGETPLHLRLTAYDRFDGVTWSEAPFTQRQCTLSRDAEPRWLSLNPLPAPVYAGSRSHQIKVGLLDTQVLPIPSHVRRFRLGRANQPDFYAWAQEDLLRMQRKVPPGVLIDTEAQTLSPPALRKVHFASPPPAPAHLVSPYDGRPIDPAVAELARQWAGGTPRGWAQVEAVIARLRAWCVHHREARAPPDCEDVVADFLLRSRRGPDYAFASAAVVLLRALDYPTRLVGGFYASPERYDRSTEHTPVIAADAHLWAEVLLPPRLWVTIEPTPGYEVLPPVVPWTERCRALWAAAWSWVQRQAAVLALSLAAAAVLVCCRRRVFDGLATFGWWLAPAGTWRACVLRTLRLLERRARWAGRPRPPGQPPTRWYGAAAQAAGPEFGTELERLVTLAGWATFAPPTSRTCRPVRDAEVHALCRRVVRRWTLRRFRSATRPAPQRLVLP